jgi:transposase
VPPWREEAVMARPSKYASEFRREAVELVPSSGRTIAEAARSLGISDGTLGNWVKADREARERAADPDALTEEERAELKRLGRETAQQAIDLEILRKAAACFARETDRRSVSGSSPITERLLGGGLVPGGGGVPFRSLRLEGPAAFGPEPGRRSAARGDPQAA